VTSLTTQKHRTSQHVRFTVLWFDEIDGENDLIEYFEGHSGKWKEERGDLNKLLSNGTVLTSLCELRTRASGS
jgi:hypothetical protein